MSVPYEKIVAEDLNLGVGEVEVTMPGGGTATGNKIGPHTFAARAVSASLSVAQEVDAAIEVIEVDTEELDTDSWFDHTTFEFQPTVAGVYLIVAQLTVEEFTGVATAYLYRGASEVARVDAQRDAAEATIQVMALISMDGDDDVVTLRCNHDHGAARDITAATFSAILINKLDV